MSYWKIAQDVIFQMNQLIVTSLGLAGLRNAKMAMGGVLLTQCRGAQGQEVEGVAWVEHTHCRQLGWPRDAQSSASNPQSSSLGMGCSEAGCPAVPDQGLKIQCPGGLAETKC